MTKLEELLNTITLPGDMGSALKGLCTIKYKRAIEEGKNEEEALEIVSQALHDILMALAKDLTETK